MTPPDPWVSRHLDLVREGGEVLDIAAGSGRHTALALGMGLRVLAVDRDVAALEAIPAHDRLEVMQADLEAGSWPLQGRSFDGIIVCNYLWRPLFRLVSKALKPGGILIWTTFAAGNERFGRPRNPDFLLQRNELLDAFTHELEVIAFADGERAGPSPAVRQSIVARRAVVDRSEAG